MELSAPLGLAMRIQRSMCETKDLGLKLLSSDHLYSHRVCRAPRASTEAPAPHPWLSGISLSHSVKPVCSEPPDCYPVHSSCPADSLSLSPLLWRPFQSVLKWSALAFSQIPAAFTSCDFPSWHHTFSYHIIFSTQCPLACSNYLSTLAMVSLLTC